MNKQFYTQESIQTVEDLINAQVYFQKFISSNLPAKDFISFENIQESLKHDFFQRVEIQEFLEASKEEQQEEFIDCLLFLINKYLFLGIADEDTWLMPLFYKDFTRKDKTMEYMFRKENDLYLYTIRNYTFYKSWKIRDNKSCVLNKDAIQLSFIKSLKLYNYMLNKAFDSIDDFNTILSYKLNKNINRQLNKY